MPLKVFIKDNFRQFIPGIYSDIKLKQNEGLYITVIHYPGEAYQNLCGYYKHWSLATSDDPDFAVILNPKHIKYLEVIGLDSIEKWQPFFEKHNPTFFLIWKIENPQYPIC